MNDELLRRLPPQNIEAEQSVIGAVVIRNELYDALSEIVERDDFYRESHRLLWEGITALAQAKRPIDDVTLADVLRPHWKAIGGGAYIAECAARVPAPSMALHYAALVREKAIQRRIAVFGTEIASKAYEAPAQWSPEFTEEILAVGEYELARIASQTIRKPEPKKAETLATALWKIEHRVEDSVPTGFAPLDRGFGGFNVGHLTMLAARTSKGKTALAMNFAINAAKAGFATAYFTLEMSAEEMWLRALGCEAQVDIFVARRNGYRDGQRERMENARKALESLPLEILYRPSMRPRDLRIECRRLAREMGGLKLAIVDYFNLMRGDRREKERWREMQEAILALKGLAGELGIPLLVLSQLNRETSESEPPSLSNLRDTGATEEHASNVLFIWQEPRGKDAAGPGYDDWESVKVIIEKQRNGPAGLHVPMEFKKQWGAFLAR